MGKETLVGSEWGGKWAPQPVWKLTRRDKPVASNGGQTKML
jgi:hypothetical protein